MTFHSPSPTMSPRSQGSSSPALALAEDQPEWQSDLQVDFGHELKTAVDEMLQAYPKYISFIV